MRAGGRSIRDEAPRDAALRGLVLAVNAPKKARANGVIAENRKARHHYDVVERYEAGIVLKGSEVKSLREGRVDLSEAFGAIERGELWLRQLYVASYFAARSFPHAERGARKLLLHAREIVKIERAIMREGYTLVPLDLHFRNGFMKVTLAVARGKKDHDKRRAIAERELDRELSATVRSIKGKPR